MADDGDIPEVGEEWFQKARLVMPAGAHTDDCRCQECLITRVMQVLGFEEEEGAVSATAETMETAANVLGPVAIAVVATMDERVAEAWLQTIREGRRAMLAAGAVQVEQR